jgi:hypothetical protein
MLGAILLAAAASCARFHGIASWAGNIHVTFSREAHTPYYIERLSGSASYSNRMSPSDYGVTFNGYSWTWMGHAMGSESFTDEVTHADGSPLSRPDRTTGEGPILADPPLGMFGPEQFWINPGKCLYAFYTSAAVNAQHTYEASSAQGIDVHVEGIPLPAAGYTLSGSRTYALPHRNYYGGDQFHIPCRLVDWCSRSAGPGSATISWTFAPAKPVAPHPTPKPTPQPLHCPKSDHADATRAGRLRLDFRAAFGANGFNIPLHSIDAALGSLPRVHVRLDGLSNVLPGSACVDEAIANGSAKPGSQTGAMSLITAAVQQTGGQTRVTVREVDVATGAIQKTGLGDASGTSDASIIQAAATAIGAAGLTMH